ncbi:MAG: T9SS type A sorting domain-containing protein, partial [Bacteroidetes bacterium]|nr:T9SS type A sorting domain-containing protein [Bacteroidota bacterium]
FNTNNTFKSECQNQSYSTSSCPDRLNRTLNELHTRMGYLRPEIDDKENLIDGNIKATLLESIQNDEAESELLTALLDISPYLSDQVMMAAINEKPTPLSSGALFDIMAANSPLTSQAWDALEVSDLLDYDHYNNLQALQDGISPRMELEVEISEMRHELSITANEMVNIYLTDTLIEHALDSVVYVLKFEQPDNDGRLIPFYIEMEDYVKAGNIMDSIINTATMPDFIEMQQINLAIKQSADGIYTLKSDSVLLEKINTLALQEHHSLESKQAKVLLSWLNNEQIDEEIEELYFDEGPGMMLTNHQAMPELKKESIVELFPNPMQGGSSINYKIKDKNLNPSEEQLTFYLYDLYGKTISTKRIINLSGSIELPGNALPNGIYFYRFMNGENKFIDTGKLLIAK